MQGIDQTNPRSQVPPHQTFQPGLEEQGQPPTYYIQQTPPPQPSFPSAFLDNCLWAVSNVVNDSPYTYAAGAGVYTLGEVVVLGIGSSQAAAFVMIACVVHRVFDTIFPLFVGSPRKWQHFVVFLNSATITLGIAARLGIAIPTVKSLVASLGVAAVVKIIQHVIDRRHNRQEQD